MSCAGSQQPTTFQLSNSLIRSENYTLHLDKLPLEVLRRIISYGSCKAILVLRCVCRVLYRACSDIYIVKHILERGSIQASDSAESSSLAWYDSVLSPRVPFSSWMRYALAHEHVEQFIESLKGTGLKQRRFLRCLPQLLALHCERVSTEAE